MIRFVLYATFLVSLLVPNFSSAQSTILQAGPTAQGRAPMYVYGGQQPWVQDSGPAAGGGTGVGLSELGLTFRGTGTSPYTGVGTGPNGSNLCDYDGPVNAANGFHYLCMSPNSLAPNGSSGGAIVYGYGGIASPLPLQFIVNGSVPCVMTANGLVCTNVTINWPVHTVPSSVTNYTIVATDYYIDVYETAATTINLPQTPTPVTGATYVVTDISGNAASDAITVVGGIYNVNGTASKIINTAYQSVQFHFNSTVISGTTVGWVTN